jgi:hypothetical protein
MNGVEYLTRFSSCQIEKGLDNVENWWEKLNTWRIDSRPWVNKSRVLGDHFFCQVSTAWPRGYRVYIDHCISTFSPGSNDPRFEFWSYLITLLCISACSPVQLDWFIKGRVVCGLPVIHSPKIPHGIIRKSVGESPRSWASNPDRSGNH